MKRSVVKYKGRNPVPINWEFKSKEEAEELICLKLRNVVNGYMHVPGFEFTQNKDPDMTDLIT